jgi:hypothetical protein
LTAGRRAGSFSRRHIELVTQRARVPFPTNGEIGSLAGNVSFRDSSRKSVALVLRRGDFFGSGDWQSSVGFAIASRCSCFAVFMVSAQKGGRSGGGGSAARVPCGREGWAQKSNLAGFGAGTAVYWFNFGCTFCESIRTKIRVLVDTEYLLKLLLDRSDQRASRSRRVCHPSYLVCRFRGIHLWEVRSKMASRHESNLPSHRRTGLQVVAKNCTRLRTLKRAAYAVRTESRCLTPTAAWASAVPRPLPWHTPRATGSR